MQAGDCETACVQTHIRLKIACRNAGARCSMQKVAVRFFHGALCTGRQKQHPHLWSSLSLPFQKLLYCSAVVLIRMCNHCVVQRIYFFVKQIRLHRILFERVPVGAACVDQHRMTPIFEDNAVSLPYI